MRKTLSRPQTWIGIVVSLLALGYALRGIAWSDLVAELQRADYRWLIPASLTIVLGQFLRTERWRRLFAAESRPGFRDSFAILCVGYLVSTVFPLRLGDPFRAWAVDRYAKASLVDALASVLVERALDLLSIFLLLALLLPEPEAALLGARFGPGPWADAGTLRLLTGGFTLLAYLGLIVAATIGQPLGRGVESGLTGLGLPRALSGRLGRLAAGFAEGLRPLRQPRQAATALAWSLAVWLVGGLGYWLVMFAFDLRLNYSSAVFVMCGVAFAAILPSTPGYTGVFHAAVVVGLELIAGTPRDLAFSYAVVEHGITMLVLLVMGPIGLRLLGMSRRELGQRVERSTEGL